MSKLRARVSRDSVRDARIQAEVGVPTESIEAWRAYVRRAASFPFSATYLARDGNVPLCPGAKVQVIGITQQAKHEVALFVKVIDGQRSINIPLELLEPFERELGNTEPVRDWHYWCRLRA